jgi:hypothetical protein
MSGDKVIYIDISDHSDSVYSSSNSTGYCSDEERGGSDTGGMAHGEENRLFLCVGNNMGSILACVGCTALFSFYITIVANNSPITMVDEGMMQRIANATLIDQNLIGIG